jgi:penicillin-binding protein 1A
MTAAYASVAGGGYKVVPSGVLAVIDGRGAVRADFLTVVRTRIIPKGCIEPTQAVLREVVRSGTGRAAMLKRWPAYGKTGTSSENADAWFVGWTAERVFGVWMGRRRGEQGPALAGAGAPATYFSRVMTAAHEWAELTKTLEGHRLAASLPEGRIGPTKRSAERRPAPLPQEEVDARRRGG